MKTVAIYSYVPKLHSCYNDIVKNPPEGYTYAVDPSQLNNTMKAFYTHKTVKGAAVQLGKFVDTIRIKEKIYTYKKFPPHDLLYSAGYIVLRKEPYVVDMEFPSSFTGYDMKRFERRKAEIGRVLSLPYCKHIIPWTSSGAQVMINAFPDLAHKVTPVPLTVPAKTVQHVERNDGKVRMLFIGSANLPNDFEIKGGPEVLEAFSRLIKKRDDLELIFRCFVTPELKARYGSLPGLKIIDYMIPWKELENWYATSDFFVGPAHHTPNVAHLEAMSYGLPVIATDVWENSKIVSKEVGLLVPQHKGAVYFVNYGMPNWAKPDFMLALQKPDEERIQAIMDAIETLADSAQLRKKMREAALLRVKEGPYSIAGKNKILKKIYDEATS
jgi:glycosyltransferase involved in cell wall biosynthesis